MKQRRKHISILLSMLLLLSVFQPAVALDADPDFEQIYEIGTRLLGDIEHEKELYGLGGVNFDNLYIGEYIPAYIANETGLTQSNIRYYPILENGEWVATLTCSKSNGIWNAQLSNTFVPELPEIDANDNLKLVFDSNTGYLVKNSAIHNITSYNAVADRVDLASSPMTISAAGGQKLINKRAVEIGKFDDNRQVRSNVPSQFYFDVPRLSQQPYQKACGAFCIKSVAEYYGTTCSIAQIYNYAFPGENKDPNEDGMSTYDIHRVLTDNLGYEVDAYNQYATFDTLKSVLCQSIPILAVTVLSTDEDLTIGHCIILRGYTTYMNSDTHIGSHTFMNPWTGTYQAGTVDNNNVYSYKDGNGNTQNLLAFTAVRD